jgi:hypothetical protein
MEGYFRIKEENDEEQLPKRNKGVDCGRKEGKETLATNKSTC